MERDQLEDLVPEQWLAEEKYPVVVDPVIGTTTVGSQNKWEIYEGEPPEPLMFELSIPVNRFLVPETINGLCTAYAYVNQDDGEAGGRPVFYSDNGNVPLTRKSTEEGFIDLRVNSGKPIGWRSAAFKSNGSIASGSYIWFGVFCEYYWLPRFDWGAKCYADMWDAYDSIPNTYPITKWTEIYDFKLSMYFEYTSAQNYVRTLTQGVRLTDSRKLSERFNRTMTQKLLITDNRKQAAGYKRSSIQTAKVNSSVSKFETFFRKCVFTASGSMTIGRSPLFLRGVIENIKIAMEKRESRTITRKCFEDVKINSESKRIHNIFLKLYDSLNGFDLQTVNLIILRSVNENLSLTEQFRNSRAFIRSLIECAANIAETKHEAEYYREQTDVVQAVGNVFRGLLLFIRIVTEVFIRDYLIRRFLAAREELVLKSCITREIKLESKIN